MNKANKYTIPCIYKGKKPIKIPNGSTLAKEWAKNDWYINFSFNGKQYRIKGDLNRIKDHKEKLYQSEVLLQSIKNDLKNGYDPSNPDIFLEQIISENIALSDAVTKYIEELATYARPKTVGSYKSKLHYFSESFPNKLVKSFITTEIEKYIHNKIHSTLPAKLYLNGKSFELKKPIPWASNTVRSARGIFHSFFEWCIQNKYYLGFNPVSKIEQKRIRSEVSVKPRHSLFSKEDITKLMDYLDENDKPTAFFARMIYSTCMRPGEICQLRLQDIDLENKQIIIPLDVTKNTRKTSVDIIDIEPHFYEELIKLKLENYKPYFYLTSKYENIIGEVSIGKNKPYKQLIKALKILNLNEKGYTLYSFKHFSNLQRFNSGWSLAEIMKANRHSSISMTEKYLKGINKVTDISKKEVPKI
jgi:integrase